MSRLSPPTRQSGAALITGLIFLVVLTMVGVTAARMSMLEERMSGNTRDRSLAMQAAELTLRDAERDINNAVVGSARNIAGISGFVADCGASTTATTADDGLCYGGPSVWPTTSWSAATWNANMTAAPSVVYGTFTGAAATAGLSAQPRYLIEGNKKIPPGSGEVFYYRITVRAQGINPNTVVWLQETYRP